MRELAVDAGQSGVRALLTDRDDRGGVTAAHPVPLDDHRGIRTDLPLAGQLVALAERVVASAGAVDVLAVGTTGFDPDAVHPADFAPLTASGVRRVLLAHDSITSYLGALGAQEGAVVASGTGVVTLAVGADSTARVDGWGNIMGDAGSGFWFGRAGLDAAMRAYDGRGPATVLLDRLRKEFGDVEGAYLLLQADPDRVRRTAGYARWVTAAAAAGDEVAAGICRAGGEELALSVATGLARVGIDPAAEVPVAAIGGVFGAPEVAGAFAASLAERAPRIRRRPPQGDGLDGAATLPVLPATSALQQHVVRIDLP